MLATILLSSSNQVLVKKMNLGLCLMIKSSIEIFSYQRPDVLQDLVGENQLCIFLQPIAFDKESELNLIHCKI